MVLSYILSAIINFLTGHGAAMGIEGNLSYIPIWLVLVAIAFATLIGTLAGFFPATPGDEVKSFSSNKNRINTKAGRNFNKIEALPVCYLIFFNYLNLQIIKINGIYKIILIESCLGVALEFLDGAVQPDRLTQVKLITDLVQCMKYLMCAGVLRFITDCGVTEHSVVFKFFSP